MRTGGLEWQLEESSVKYRWRTCLNTYLGTHVDVVCKLSEAKRRALLDMLMVRSAIYGRDFFGLDTYLRHAHCHVGFIPARSRKTAQAMKAMKGARPCLSVCLSVYICIWDLGVFKILIEAIYVSLLLLFV